MKFFKNLYFTYLFFILSLGIAFLFAFSFAIPVLFPITQILLMGLFAIVIIELILLYSIKKPLKGQRDLMNPMSLGDKNLIKIKIKNNYKFPVRLVVYDNPPNQFQLRDLNFKYFILPNEQKMSVYHVVPNERGKYIFDHIFAYASCFLNLVQRKIIIESSHEISVHPSIINMKRMELKVFTKTASVGIKKIRRLGHNNEFEQIKNYVQGDDFRTINWKATSRTNELMVNQYQDERAQNVYSIIDKSRSMRMPFNDLTLLDYAINSTLAFSNITLLKGDKVGLMTFADKLGAKLAAERNANQLRRIMELLYQQKTRFLEANFNLLYHGIRNNLKGRSLIMLYTNIETDYALKRILPMLKKINQSHLLVVIFFENIEIEKSADIKPKNIEEVYLKTFAEKHKYDKKRIAIELKKNGIQTILTKPENLSIDTINKYLEIKSRGMI